jgi:hypothetical protein
LKFSGSCPNCLEIKKNQGNRTIFLQLQIEFLFSSLKVTTLFYLPQNFQKLFHVFDNMRANQNPFWDFGPLGVNFFNVPHMPRNHWSNGFGYEKDEVMHTDKSQYDGGLEASKISGNHM